MNLYEWLFYQKVVLKSLQILKPSKVLCFLYVCEHLSFKITTHTSGQAGLSFNLKLSDTTANQEKSPDVGYSPPACESTTGMFIRFIKSDSK